MTIWGRSTNKTMEGLIEALNNNENCFIEISDKSSVYTYYYKGDRFWSIGKVDNWSNLLAKKLGIKLSYASNLDCITCKGKGYFISKYIESKCSKEEL